jgi:lipoprotein-anchoring transpeptidase ErfK/SrfK
MGVFEKASHPVPAHEGGLQIGRWASLLAAAALAMLMIAQPARANLLVEIDKAKQRMTITVDGRQLYQWPVATGGIDYDTPNGAFRPFRMQIDHHSDEWDNAPMPYSIFFTTIGNAIHGTYEQRSLGHPVSHGCVRLSLANAATLWGLVKQQKMANTTVVITGEIPGVDPAKVVHVDPSELAFGKPLIAPDPAPRPPAAPDFFFLFH